MLHLLLHGTFPYCLDTYESCMSHVITFSETISPSMLKIRREKERENFSVSNRYFCTDPWQYQRLRNLHMCLLFIIVWGRAFVKITSPRGFHSKCLLGTYTHPFPGWIYSSEAPSTCLFIYMVAWFFSEVLSYRAIPVKITPELSINTLTQKFQAVNKSVKLVTCWCPAPLLWHTGSWACCGDEPPSSSLCTATSPVTQRRSPVLSPPAAACGGLQEPPLG